MYHHEGKKVKAKEVKVRKVKVSRGVIPKLKDHCQAFSFEVGHFWPAEMARLAEVSTGHMWPA